ncbi:MAG: hypothetical protein K6B67_02390 [Lachnospiraceae bacterium]|nr:hypothetical protein [Lachnospiraceae bacterium]
MNKVFVNFKKVASMCIVALMIVTAMPQLAFSVYAAEAPNGYTTDEHGIMSYRNNYDNIYDIKGFVSGQWRQVTYNCGGFKASAWPYDKRDKLSISVTPNFVVDGQAILLSYNVRNNSNETVSDFRFFLASDTAVNGNDASSNTVDEDNVITMTDSETGVSLFAFSTTEGGIAVPTEYDDCNNSYCSVLGGGNPSLTDFVTSAYDSAFVTYFPSTSLAAGQSTQYTLVVGMADKSEISTIIQQAKSTLLSTSLDYVNECLVDLDANGTYVLKDKNNPSKEYTVQADSNGKIPLAGTDINGAEYDFVGKTITIYKKGSGDVADSEPTDVEVAARPTSPDSPTVTNTPEVISAGDIHTTNNTITIQGVEGQEYRLDDGQWVSPDANGDVIFSGLDAHTSYQIYTRTKATNAAPASAATEAIEVITYGMFDPVVNGFDGVYDGNAHIATVSTTVSGANITYALEENGTYRSQPYTFVKPGNNTVYYKIQKENYYDAVGTINVNIGKMDRPTYKQVQITDTKVYSTRAVVSEISPKTSGVKYAISTSSTAPTSASRWQTSNIFDGLNPNTTYYIFAKNVEDEYYKESVSSPKVIQTESAVDAKKFKVVNGSSKVVTSGEDINIEISGWINDITKVNEVYLKLRKAGETEWIEMPIYDATNITNKLKVDLAVGGNGLEYNSVYEYQYVVKATIDGVEKEIPSDVVKFKTPKQQEEEQNVVTGEIAANIKNTTGKDKTYIVSIEHGNTVVQSHSVAIGAGESTVVNGFDNIPVGTYNLVIRDQDGGYVETRIIEVKANGVSNVSVKTVDGDVKSKVEIVSDSTPNVAVNKLYEIISAEEMAEAEDGSKGVEVKLTAETKSESEAAGVTEIKEVLNAVNEYPNVTKAKEVKQILDFSLFKISRTFDSEGNQTNEDEPENIGDNNSVVLEIAIPYNGEYENVGIIRYHVNEETGEEETTVFTELSSRPEDNYIDGTFYVGEEYIYIYASKFSTYALIGDSDADADDYELGNGGSGIIGVTSDTVVPGYVFQQNVTYEGRRVAPPNTGDNSSSTPESSGRIIVDMWLSDEEDEEDGENE